MANLRDVIETRFGAVRTESAINRSGSSFGTSAAQILRNDPRRLGATIVNLGSVAVYILPDQDVTNQRGIRLDPSGGNVTLLFEEEFDVVGWEWFIIADAAATPVLTIELLTR